MIHGLYAITPDSWGSQRLLDGVEAAVEGGASVLQYRRKAIAISERRKEAAAIREICRPRGVPLIVNDDPTLAAEVHADGVHLGRDDGSVAAARAVLGGTSMIGVSCYDDLERAQRAFHEGADYVAFGSFFPSAVKPHAVRPPVSLLSAARDRIALPRVAIGGITVHNAALLIEEGADAVAVISDLFDAQDIRARAELFSSLFRATQPFIEVP